MEVILIYLGFSALIGYWYSQKGGNGSLGCLLSLIFSPMLACLFVLISSPGRKCTACKEHVRSGATICSRCLTAQV